jgi:hypothetical protein
MAKKALILAIILLLLGGGAALFFKQNKKNPVEKNIVKPLTQNEVTETPKQKSLQDLIASGVPQKCTYSDISDGVNISGTSYISGGEVRADYSTEVQNNTSVGHMIFDGTTSYVWMDGSTTGFKLEKAELTPGESSVGSQKALDMQKSLDYKCGIWVPDATLFQPPANIKFSSLSVPNITSGAVNNNQSMCATCDSLTGEQKTQCLTALKCN